jgi:hypothetical protein
MNVPAPVISIRAFFKKQATFNMGHQYRRLAS